MRAKDGKRGAQGVCGLGSNPPGSIPHRGPNRRSCLGVGRPRVPRVRVLVRRPSMRIQTRCRRRATEFKDPPLHHDRAKRAGQVPAAFRSRNLAFWGHGDGRTSAIAGRTAQVTSPLSGRSTCGDAPTAAFVEARVARIAHNIKNAIFRRQHATRGGPTPTGANSPRSIRLRIRQPARVFTR